MLQKAGPGITKDYVQIQVRRMRWKVRACDTIMLTFSSIQDIQVNGVLISSRRVTMGRKWPRESHTTAPTYPDRAKKWCVASGRSNDQNTTLEAWSATFSNAKKPVAVSTLNHDQSSWPLTLSLVIEESSVRARRPATVLWIPNTARVAARFQKTFSLASRDL